MAQRRAVGDLGSFGAEDATELEPEAESRLSKGSGASWSPRLSDSEQVSSSLAEERGRAARGATWLARPCTCVSVSSCSMADCSSASRMSGDGTAQSLSQLVDEAGLAAPKRAGWGAQHARGSVGSGSARSGAFRKRFAGGAAGSMARGTTAAGRDGGFEMK